MYDEVCITFARTLVQLMGPEAVEVVISGVYDFKTVFWVEGNVTGVKEKDLIFFKNDIPLRSNDKATQEIFYEEIRDKVIVYTSNTNRRTIRSITTILDDDVVITINCDESKFNAEKIQSLANAFPLKP